MDRSRRADLTRERIALFAALGVVDAARERGSVSPIDRAAGRRAR